MEDTQRNNQATVYCPDCKWYEYRGIDVRGEPWCICRKYVIRVTPGSTCGEGERADDDRRLD